MKNSIKAWHIFRNIIIFLFILFIITYNNTSKGNYNTVINEKTILTAEKIKEFEDDIAKGEYIDMKKYSTPLPDTSNFTSNLSYEIGESIDKFFNEKVVNVLTFIGNLFK